MAFVSVPPFFCNIVYNLSNFVFYTELNGVKKMQFIFFVPPNEELEGTLHPKKFGGTPKNEGYMYPQMKKPMGMLQI
jgi:hypothetical protein